MSSSLNSIIVSFHDLENYLEECVTLSDKQAYESNGIIVMDDGFTDGIIEYTHKKLFYKERLFADSS